MGAARQSSHHVRIARPNHVRSDPRLSQLLNDIQHNESSMSNVLSIVECRSTINEPINEPINEHESISEHVVS